MKVSSTIVTLVLLICSSFVFQSCDNNKDYYRTFFPKAAPPPYDSAAAVSDSTLSGGTKIYTIKRGSGDFHVVYQDQIIVRLTGRTGKGKIFETSFTKREGSSNTKILHNLTSTPIQGQFTTYYLVEGLRRGLLGMKEGEQRIIRVPPSMGYTDSDSYENGRKVSGKTLIYNVELVQILR
jgi:FKBP-type peptidyl-prolyl cis-trans isomerase